MPTCEIGREELFSVERVEKFSSPAVCLAFVVGHFVVISGGSTKAFISQIDGPRILGPCTGCYVHIWLLLDGLGR